ncbi:unnamed protein product [Calypogeia fissa]
MMAVSVQASSNVVSRLHGIPWVSSAKGGGVGNLLRSQFLGSGPIHIACGTKRTHVVVHNAAKVRAIRSASFFEKLGQLFSSSELDQEQVLAIYEINNGDRNSPVILKGTDRGSPVVAENPSANIIQGLGDFIPYTNSVYDASGKVKLGTSAGLCICIEHFDLASGGDRYETTYTHYIGDYGQLSGMGPYYVTKDSEMVVTGGTGIFKGARGVVKLHSEVPPIKILYTYYLTGIPKLPAALTSPSSS